MHDVRFLTAAVIVFGTALIVAWVFRAVRAPSIIGFLFTGLLIGPDGLELIAAEEIAPLAELGLVLLLFTVGLELSPAPLLRMGKGLLVASGVQIGATAGLGFLAAVLFMNVGVVPAAIVGVMAALSSTAIVLKQLSDRRETDTLMGTIIIGVLLLQDVLVIGFMLFLPLFAVQSSESWQSGTVRLAISVAGMAAVVLTASKVLPFVLKHLVRPGGREFVTLFAVVMAFGGAWLAGLAGWSLPLGACIAGLLLAQADEKHQVAAEILPFRDVFNALFFISLGMLADLDGVGANLGPILLAVVATIILKGVIAAAAVRFAGWSWRPAFMIGLGLCTVSEFGYVLAAEAESQGLIPEGLLSSLVSYSLGTMALGAVLMPMSRPITDGLIAIFARNEATANGPDQTEHALTGHIVVVGYGVNGQNLSRILRSVRLPFCVIEMNQGLAQTARDAELRVVVGDASREFILSHAGLDVASALVVAINDPPATQKIVGQARQMQPSLFILARTRFVNEIDILYKLGANLVVPEEFETSLEIAAHLLKHMDVPDNIVEGQLAAVRSGGYGLLRGKPTTRSSAAELMKVFQLTATKTHYLETGTWPCGKSIAETNLRKQTGVTIIAVVRNGQPMTNPSPDFLLQAGDVLVLVGAHSQFDSAKAVLAGAQPEKQS